MNLFLLTVTVLACWRLTHLLHAEDGPWHAITWFRSKLGGFSATLFGCFYCLSLWVSAPIALLIEEEWRLRGLLWLSISAGAILLERLTSKREESSVAAYFEEPSESASSNDPVLRTAPPNRVDTST